MLQISNNLNENRAFTPDTRILEKIYYLYYKLVKICNTEITFIISFKSA